MGVALLGCDEKDPKDPTPPGPTPPGPGPGPGPGPNPPVERVLEDLFTGFDIGTGFTVEGSYTIITNVEFTPVEGEAMPLEPNNEEGNLLFRVKADETNLYADLEMAMNNSTGEIALEQVIYLRPDQTIAGVKPDGADDFVYSDDTDVEAVQTAGVAVAIVTNIFSQDFDALSGAFAKMLEDCGTLEEVDGGYTLEVNPVALIGELLTNVGTQLATFTEETTIGDLYTNLGIEGFLNNYFEDLNAENVYAPIKFLAEMFYPMVANVLITEGLVAPEDMPDSLVLPETMDELLESAGLEPIGEDSIATYADALLTPFKTISVLELINMMIIEEDENAVPLTVDDVKDYAMYLLVAQDVLSEVEIGFTFEANEAGVMEAISIDIVVVTTEETEDEVMVITAELTASFEITYTAPEFVDVEELEIVA